MAVFCTKVSSNFLANLLHEIVLELWYNRIVECVWLLEAEEGRMYQVGEYVVYGVQGVCRILGTEKQLVNRKRTEYLVLEPLDRGASKFYLPTQNPSAMGKLQPILTRRQMDDLLKSEELRKDCWIQEENLRKQRYRDLLSAGDRVSLLQMLAAVYHHKEEQAAAGKKFHQCDDSFMRDTEKLLCSEIGLVMELESVEAREYLRSRLR